MRPISMVGERFGRLTVVEFVEKRPTTKVYLCRCDCGNTTTVQASNLRSKHVQSCGCLNSELAAVRKRTHGMRHTPEYAAYCGARSRCMNPNVERYPDYGGRGIEFRFTSFEAFYAEVGPKPVPKSNYSIDRIEVNGHYEPGNIRWTTAKTQRHNRRKKAA